MQERKSKLWNEIEMQDLVYESKYEAKLAWECKMVSMNVRMRKLQMKVQMLQVLQSSKVTKKSCNIMLACVCVPKKWGEIPPFKEEWIARDNTKNI